jgi:hypothetical protein
MLSGRRSLKGPTLSNLEHARGLLADSPLFSKLA